VTEPSPTSSWLDSLLSAPPAEQEELVRSLTPEQQAELLRWRPLWRPQPGPQTEAYDSPLTSCSTAARPAAERRTSRSASPARALALDHLPPRVPRLKAVIDAQPGDLRRSAALQRDGTHVWTFRDGRTCRARLDAARDDEQAHQGQPHDLYVFDELPEFTESQFRFVIGWNRTTREAALPRRLHRQPADRLRRRVGDALLRAVARRERTRGPRPGELRWFTTGKDGKDVEVEPSWRGVDDEGQRSCRSRARSSRAKLEDNRSSRRPTAPCCRRCPSRCAAKLLFGDFKAGREDNAYQVIPSAWVDAGAGALEAAARPTVRMSALGVDVARGGKDKTILAPRYDNWFAELLAFPGKSTPDGPAVAALVVLHARDDAVVNIDVIGVGSSPYDCLRASIGDKAVPMNGAEGSDKRDKSGSSAS
jgi:hypothetical protein